MNYELFAGTPGPEVEKIGALEDDDMVKLSEESNGKTIESLKKGKKGITKPSPSEPGLINLLEVKKEKIEGLMIENEKKEKA